MNDKTAATMRCNQCSCYWSEDDLVTGYDAKDGEASLACPECGTDHYLMDLTKFESPGRPAYVAGGNGAAVRGW